MRTLCIIPCGNQKVWDKSPNAGATAAQFVYTGPFASKCREYASKFYPEWCILSAKYGFLFPKDIVPAPYNVTFNDKSTHPITVNELRHQVMSRGLNKYDTIVVLGGKNYVGIVSEAFKGKSIQTPLKGCKGIGYMMGVLTTAVNNNKPLNSEE